jgi:hypothetical protein
MKNMECRKNFLSNQSRFIVYDQVRINSFQALRERMGLFRARKQSHTLESISEAMAMLRERFPKAGAREMTALLFFEKNLSVPR